MYPAQSNVGGKKKLPFIYFNPFSVLYMVPDRFYMDRKNGLSFMIIIFRHYFDSC